MNMQSELTNSKEIIAYLSKHFPNCFTTEGEAKPLKVGIFQDLIVRLVMDEPFSKTKLRVALRTYTANWRYLHCLKDGMHRVDLDGNPCDTITKEQAEHAALQLKESKERIKAKKQMESNRKLTQPDILKAKKTFPRSENIKKSNTTEKISDNQSKPMLNQINAERLKVGALVKVMLGSKPVPATIFSIEKDHVKVKIASGMELTVTTNHILI